MQYNLSFSHLSTLSPLTVTSWTHEILEISGIAPPTHPGMCDCPAESSSTIVLSHLGISKTPTPSMSSCAWRFHPFKINYESVKLSLPLMDLSHALTMLASQDRKWFYQHRTQDSACSTESRVQAGDNPLTSLCPEVWVVLVEYWWL